LWIDVAGDLLELGDGLVMAECVDDGKWVQMTTLLPDIVEPSQDDDEVVVVVVRLEYWQDGRYLPIAGDHRKHSLRIPDGRVKRLRITSDQDRITDITLY
jgi:hypothetical protein